MLSGYRVLLFLENNRIRKKKKRFSYFHQRNPTHNNSIQMEINFYKLDLDPILKIANLPKTKYYYIIPRKKKRSKETFFFSHCDWL